MGLQQANGPLEQLPVSRLCQIAVCPGQLAVHLWRALPGRDGLQRIEVTVMGIAKPSVTSGTGAWGLFTPVSYTHLDVYKRQIVCIRIFALVLKSRLSYN